MSGHRTKVTYSLGPGPGWRFWVKFFVVCALLLLVVGGFCYTMDEVLGIG